MTKMTNFDGGISAARLMLGYIISQTKVAPPACTQPQPLGLFCIYSWHEKKEARELVGPTDINPQAKIIIWTRLEHDKPHEG
jgi:hypothetical protein